MGGLIGKSSINGPFSMAMLNNQRVIRLAESSMSPFHPISTCLGLSENRVPVSPMANHHFPHDFDHLRWKKNRQIHNFQRSIFHGEVARLNRG